MEILSLLMCMVTLKKKTFPLNQNNTDMTVKDLKNILSNFNDEDVVLVDVHDDLLSEDLYFFDVDFIELDADINQVRICPINHLNIEL